MTSLTKKQRFVKAGTSGSGDVDADFFDLSNVLIMEAGTDGNFSRLSPAWKNILGWTMEDLMETPWVDFLHPDDIERSSRELENVFAGNEITQFTNRYRNKNGAYHTLRWNVSLRHNPKRLIGIAADLTEQIRAETAHATDKRILQLIMSGTHWQRILTALMLEIEAQSTSGMLCSVLLLDSTGQHLVHGAAPSLPDEYCRTITGMAIGADAGSCGTTAFYKRPTFVYDIEDDPLWAKYKQFALPYGLRACCSTPIFSSDYRILGTIANYYKKPHKPHRFDLELIQNAAHLAGIIIERKEAEEKLAREQAESDKMRRLYETVLSNTPDLAYVFDLDHRVTYANTVLLKMWDRTWDEAIGKRCLELGYEPWHAALHESEIDQVAATKKPIRGQVPFTGAFGTRIYDYIFVPVLNDQGEVEAVAGTTRDVTDSNANGLYPAHKARRAARPRAHAARSRRR